MPDKLHPKYMTAKGAKFSTLGLSIIAEGYGPVVIVEDVLSAIKVGRVTSTVCLLGSTPKKDANLPVTCNTAIIWLDCDAVTKAHTISRKLTLQGIKTWVIFTDKDPKCYNTDEIHRILGIPQALKPAVLVRR